MADPKKPAIPGAHTPSVPSPDEINQAFMEQLQREQEAALGIAPPALTPISQEEWDALPEEERKRRAELQRAIPTPGAEPFGPQGKRGYESEPEATNKAVADWMALREALADEIWKQGAASNMSRDEANRRALAAANRVRSAGSENLGSLVWEANQAAGTALDSPELAAIRVLGRQVRPMNSAQTEQERRRELSRQYSNVWSPTGDAARAMLPGQAEAARIVDDSLERIVALDESGNLDPTNSGSAELLAQARTIQQIDADRAALEERKARALDRMDRALSEGRTADAAGMRNLAAKIDGQLAELHYKERRLLNPEESGLEVVLGSTLDSLARAVTESPMYRVATGEARGITSATGQAIKDAASGANAEEARRNYGTAGLVDALTYEGRRALSDVGELLRPVPTEQVTLAGKMYGPTNEDRPVTPWTVATFQHVPAGVAEASRLAESIGGGALRAVTGTEQYPTDLLMVGALGLSPEEAQAVVRTRSAGFRRGEWDEARQALRDNSTAEEVLEALGGLSLSDLPPEARGVIPTIQGYAPERVMNTPLRDLPISPAMRAAAINAEGAKRASIDSDLADALTGGAAMGVLERGMMAAMYDQRREGLVNTYTQTPVGWLLDGPIANASTEILLEMKVGATEIPVAGWAFDALATAARQAANQPDASGAMRGAAYLLGAAQDLKLPTTAGLDYMLASDEPFYADVRGMLGIDQGYQSVRDFNTNFLARAAANINVGAPGLSGGALEILEAGSVDRDTLLAQVVLPAAIAGDFLIDWEGAMAVPLHGALRADRARRAAALVPSAKTSAALAGFSPSLYVDWQRLNYGLDQALGLDSRTPDQRLREEGFAPRTGVGLDGRESSRLDIDLPTALGHVAQQAALRDSATGSNPYRTANADDRVAIDSVLRTLGVDPTATRTLMDEAGDENLSRLLTNAQRILQRGTAADMTLRTSPGYLRIEDGVRQAAKAGRIPEASIDLMLGMFETLAHTNDPSNPARFFDDLELVVSDQTPITPGPGELASGGAAPWFYSAVEAAVEPTYRKGADKEGRMKAAALKSQIRRQPNVTEDELEWSGLDAWLDTRAKEGDGKVSNKEVLDFLAANNPMPEVVVLSDVDDSAAFEESDRLVFDLMTMIVNNDVDDTLSSIDISIINQYTQTPAYRLESFDTNQFGARTRERALKDFYATDSDEELIAKFASVYNRQPFDNEREMLIKMRETLKRVASAVKHRHEVGQPKFKAWTSLGNSSQNYREVLLKWPGGTAESHWEGYNSARHEGVLVHLRLTDGQDGTLIAEEVQSDWHQTGEEKGFRSDKKIAALQEKIKRETANADKMIADLRDQIIRVQAEGGAAAVSADEGLKRMAAAHTAKMAEIKALKEEARNEKKKATPDAPFKGTWHRLGVKALLRIAAEEGYKRVAIVPGVEHALRYNIGGVASRIEWKPDNWQDPLASGTLSAYDLSGQELSLTDNENISFDKVKNFIGETPAENLKASVEEEAAKVEAVKMSNMQTEEILWMFGQNNYNTEMLTDENGDLVDDHKKQLAFLKERYHFDPTQLYVGMYDGKTSDDYFNNIIDALDDAGRMASDPPMIEGEELRTGTRGFEAFYDEKIPATLKALTKKWGGRVRYEDIELETERGENILAHGLEITDAMRDEILGGLPLYAKKKAAVAGAFTPEAAARPSAPREVVAGVVAAWAGLKTPKGQITPQRLKRLAQRLVQPLPADFDPARASQAELAAVAEKLAKRALTATRPPGTWASEEVTLGKYSTAALQNKNGPKLARFEAAVKAHGWRRDGPEAGRLDTLLRKLAADLGVDYDERLASDRWQIVHGKNAKGEPTRQTIRKAGLIDEATGQRPTADFGTGPLALTDADALEFAVDLFNQSLKIPSYAGIPEPMTTEVKGRTPAKILAKWDSEVGKAIPTTAQAVKLLSDMGKKATDPDVVAMFPGKKTALHELTGPQLRALTNKLIAQVKAKKRDLGLGKLDKRADETLADIDALHTAARGNALTSEAKWLTLAQAVFGEDRTLMMPTRAAALMRDPGLITAQLQRMTEGQRADADAGMVLADEFADAYENGDMTPVDTGLLFFWGILSRRLSPYPHEAAFIDGILANIEPFIQEAVEGRFNLDRYLAWTDTVLKQEMERYGSPGTSATSNARDFGKLMLAKLGEKMMMPAPGVAATLTREQKVERLSLSLHTEPDGLLVIDGATFPVKEIIQKAGGRWRWADKTWRVEPENIDAVLDALAEHAEKKLDLNTLPTGQTYLTRLHEIMGDRSLDGRAARRRILAEMPPGLGVNTKVVSFVLLVTGRKDILVLDRVQIRHLWDAENNAERFGRLNIYDWNATPSAHTKQPEALSAWASGSPGNFLTDGRGVAVYELLEDALRAAVEKGYADAGLGQGTVGRFHWDSWVEQSAQEVSHGSLEALLRRALKRPDPFRSAAVKQGKYNTIQGGTSYVVLKDGTRGFLLERADGGYNLLDPTTATQVFNDYKNYSQRIGNRADSEFRLSEQTDAPWWDHPDIDRGELDRLADAAIAASGGTSRVVSPAEARSLTRHPSRIGDAVTGALDRLIEQHLQAQPRERIGPDPEQPLPNGQAQLLRRQLAGDIKSRLVARDSVELLDHPEAWRILADVQLDRAAKKLDRAETPEDAAAALDEITPTTHGANPGPAHALRLAARDLGRRGPEWAEAAGRAEAIANALAELRPADPNIPLDPEQVDAQVQQLAQAGLEIPPELEEPDALEAPPTLEEWTPPTLDAHAVAQQLRERLDRQSAQHIKVRVVGPGPAPRMLALEWPDKNGAISEAEVWSMVGLIDAPRPEKVYGMGGAKAGFGVVVRWADEETPRLGGASPDDAARVVSASIPESMAPYITVEPWTAGEAGGVTVTVKDAALPLDLQKKVTPYLMKEWLESFDLIVPAWTEIDDGIMLHATSQMPEVEELVLDPAPAAPPPPVEDTPTEQRPRSRVQPYGDERRGEGTPDYATQAGRGRERIRYADRSGRTQEVVVSQAKRAAAFRRWFRDSKVVDSDGLPVVVYHGAKRADRVDASRRFDKTRATSGPMAFFTSRADVASSYSSAKADTSLNPTDLPELFHYKGQKGLGRIWRSLTPEQRARFAQVAGDLGLDASDKVVVDRDLALASASTVRDYARHHRGDLVMGLWEVWINGGYLIGEEGRFKEVLAAAGIDGVTYDDPNAELPGVFPVYLSIQNPLDTAAIPPEVVAALESAAKRAPRKSAEELRQADAWDKAGEAGEPDRWIARLRGDLRDGTTFAWVTVPDFVTKTLKRMGYDGIKDQGGKYSGLDHTVWIPFEEGQVKGAFNRGTWSAREPDLLGAPVSLEEWAKKERVTIKTEAGRKVAENLYRVAQQDRGFMPWLRAATRRDPAMATRSLGLLLAARQAERWLYLPRGWRVERGADGRWRGLDGDGKRVGLHLGARTIPLDGEGRPPASSPLAAQEGDLGAFKTREQAQENARLVALTEGRLERKPKRHAADKSPTRTGALVLGQTEREAALAIGPTSYEHLLFLDDDGAHLFRGTGDVDSVVVPEDMKRSVRDRARKGQRTHAIHNHPEATTPALSASDIQTAAALGLHRIVAVAPGGRYMAMIAEPAVWEELLVVDNEDGTRGAAFVGLQLATAVGEALALKRAKDAYRRRADELGRPLTDAEKWDIGNSILANELPKTLAKIDPRIRVETGRYGNTQARDTEAATAAAAGQGLSPDGAGSVRRSSGAPRPGNRADGAEAGSDRPGAGAGAGRAGQSGVADTQAERQADIDAAVVLMADAPAPMFRLAASLFRSVGRNAKSGDIHLLIEQAEDALYLMRAAATFPGAVPSQVRAGMSDLMDAVVRHMQRIGQEVEVNSPRQVILRRLETHARQLAAIMDRRLPLRGESLERELLRLNGKHGIQMELDVQAQRIQPAAAIHMSEQRALDAYLSDLAEVLPTTDLFPATGNTASRGVVDLRASFPVDLSYALRAPSPATLAQRDHAGRIITPLRLTFPKGSGKDGGLVVVSFFDGISAGRQALHNLGARIDSYQASEIDKAAIQTSAGRWQDIEQKGDIEKLTRADFPPQVDLLIAGPPCQDYRPGRPGRNGKTGRLFPLALDRHDEIRPRWFLYENSNEMDPKDTAYFSARLGVEPITIDAGLLSGQRRVRHFWTNIPGVLTPDDLGIRGPEVMLDYETATKLGRRQVGEITDATRDYMEDVAKDTAVPRWLSTRNVIHIKPGTEKMPGIYRIRGKGAPYDIVTHDLSLWRRLAVVEAEALQGFPDGYTDAAPNRKQALHGLGNSWNVPTIEHVLSHLSEEAGLILRDTREATQQARLAHAQEILADVERPAPKRGEQMDLFKAPPRSYAEALAHLWESDNPEVWQQAAELMLVEMQDPNGTGPSIVIDVVQVMLNDALAEINDWPNRWNEEMFDWNGPQVALKISNGVLCRTVFDQLSDQYKEKIAKMAEKTAVTMMDAVEAEPIRFSDEPEYTGLHDGVHHATMEQILETDMSDHLSGAGELLSRAGELIQLAGQIRGQQPIDFDQINTLSSQMIDKYNLRVYERLDNAENPDALKSIVSDLRNAISEFSSQSAWSAGVAPDTAGSLRGDHPSTLPRPEAPAPSGPLYSTSGRQVAGSFQAGTRGAAPGPWFYSAVEAAVPALFAAKNTDKTGRVKASVIKQQLPKQPNVKADELDWLDLNEWLDERAKTGDGKISREEMQNYIDDNKARVNVIELNDAEDSVVDAALTELEDLVDEARTDLEASLPWIELDIEDDPGQDDKRNLLITYNDRHYWLDELLRYPELGGYEFPPELIKTLTSIKQTLDRMNQQTANMKKYGEARFKELSLGEEREEGGPRDWNMPPVSNYRNLLLQLDRKGGKGRRYVYASHWGYKRGVGDTIENVLLHLRLSDVDVKGRRLLLVEEVQSDWHQQGESKGWTDQDAALTAQIEAIEEQRRELHRQIESGAPNASLLVDRWSKLAQEQHKLETRRLRTIEPPPGRGEWHRLGAKAIIRYAAENGYDGIVLTDGNTHAERYSHQAPVKTLEWKATRDYDGNMTGELVARDAAGRIQRWNGREDPDSGLTSNSDTVRDPAKLDLLMPRELADEVRAEIEQTDDGRERWSAILTLPEERVIGGEGFAAFYDKKMPATIESLLKKLGGENAAPELITLGARYDSYMEHRTELKGRVFRINRRAQEAVLAGQPLFMARDGKVAGSFQSEVGQQLDEAAATLEATPSALETRRRLAAGVDREALLEWMERSGEGERESAEAVLADPAAAEILAADFLNDTLGVTVRLGDGRFEVDALTEEARRLVGDGELVLYAEGELGPGAVLHTNPGALDGALPVSEVRVKVADLVEEAGSEGTRFVAANLTRADVIDSGNLFELEARRMERIAGSFKNENGRSRITLYKLANRRVMLHEVGHLVEHLLDPADRALMARHFDSRNGQLTRKGQEEFAEAWAIYTETALSPHPRTRALFATIYARLSDMWTRSRGAIQTQRDIPPEVVKLWDRWFKPSKIAMQQAAIQAPLQAQSFPRVEVPARADVRAQAGLSRQRAEKAEAEGIDTRRSSIMQGMGVKDGERLPVPELYARAYGYVIAEKARRLFGEGQLERLTTRTVVPKSRVKGIREEVRAILAMRIPSEPVPGMAAPARYAGGGLFPSTDPLVQLAQTVGQDGRMEMSPAQAAGLQGLAIEIGGEPMGDRLPEWMLDPATPLDRWQRISLEDYNAVVEGLIDTRAGVAARRSRAAEGVSPTMGYALVRAIGRIPEALERGTGFSGLKRAQEWIAEHFITRRKSAEVIDPGAAELIEASLRELGEAGEDIRRWAMAAVKKDGGTSIRRTLRAVSTQLKPPVALVHIPYLTRALGHLGNGSMPAHVGHLLNPANLSSLETALHGGRASISQAARVALDNLRLLAQDRALLQSQAGRDLLARSTETLRAEVQDRLVLVEQRGAAILACLTGNATASSVTLTKADLHKAYNLFYTGRWSHIEVGAGESLASWAADRGYLTGYEQDTYSRIDPNTAILELLVRLRALEIQSVLAERLALYGLTTRTDESQPGTAPTIPTNDMPGPFLEKVRHYIELELTGQAVWQVAIDETTGKATTITKPPQPEKGHDMMAYNEAIRLLAAWGIDRAAEQQKWVLKRFPDGSSALVPPAVAQDIDTALNNAARVGTAGNQGDIGMRKVGSPELYPGNLRRRIGDALSTLLNTFAVSTSLITRGVTVGNVIPNFAYYGANAFGAILQTYARQGLLGTLRAGAANPILTMSVAGHLVAEGRLQPDANPEKVDRTLVTQDGRIYSSRQLAVLAQKHGLNSSAIKAETARSLARDIAHKHRRIWRRIVNAPADVLRIWQDTMTEAATLIDNYARVGVMIDELDRGASPAQAVQAAREAGYDYSDLTDTEKRVMRQLIMFYAFQRRNIAAFWDTFLRNPHRILGQLRLANGLREVYLDDEERQAIPDTYALRLELAFRQSEIETHRKSKIAYLAPQTNISDVLNLYTDLFMLGAEASRGRFPEEETRRMLARLTPWTQAPFVLYFGSDLFFGKELDDNDDVPPSYIALDYTVTGGYFTHSVFDVAPKTSGDPLKWYEPYNAQRYKARNGRAWWLFKNIGAAIPGGGRSMDTVDTLLRVGLGGQVIDAAGSLRLAGMTAAPADFHPRIPAYGKLLQQDGSDITQPHVGLTRADESLRLLGIRAVYYPHPAAARDMIEADAARQVSDRLRELDPDGWYTKTPEQRRKKELGD